MRWQGRSICQQKTVAKFIRSVPANHKHTIDDRRPLEMMVQIRWLFACRVLGPCTSRAAAAAAACLDDAYDNVSTGPLLAAPRIRDASRTSGFVDDVIFSRSGPYAASRIFLSVDNITD